ncbi:MAG: hypothetical protein ACMUIP_01840 [bacterium]
MWKLIKSLFKLVKITLIALASSLLLYAVLWVLGAILLIPVALFGGGSFATVIKSVYGAYGFQTIFGIQYIGLLYSALVGKDLRYLIEKIFRKKKALIRNSFKELESYYDKYQGVHFRINKELKRISRINHMYKSYILANLNKDELLYKKTYKTLLDINGFFDNKLEVLKKNYELQKTIKGNESFAGQARQISQAIDDTYCEMDEKLNQLTSLVIEFNPKKKELDFDSGYINSEIGKILNIFGEL